MRMIVTARSRPEFQAGYLPLGESRRMRTAIMALRIASRAARLAEKPSVAWFAMTDKDTHYLVGREGWKFHLYISQPQIVFL